MTDRRFEPRPHPTSAVPGILGAWDHKHDDWARDPGPSRTPLVFVALGQLERWAATWERPPGPA